MENRENYKGLNGYELCQLANQFLKENGFDIWGREMGNNEHQHEKFYQTRFETRMQTGAYCRQSDRRK